VGGRLGELIWTRRYSFQSVHALHAGALVERAHGHQYFLEVSFEGRDIDAVDAVVEPLVANHLHARELLEIQPSTGEAIVEWIDHRLRETSIAPRLRAVALQETRKNRFVSAKTESKYV
jgi:6-pyruvoyl-tetrahydropterin synthase